MKFPTTLFLVALATATPESSHDIHTGFPTTESTTVSAPIRYSEYTATILDVASGRTVFTLAPSSPVRSDVVNSALGFTFYNENESFGYQTVLRGSDIDTAITQPGVRVTAQVDCFQIGVATLARCSGLIKTGADFPQSAADIVASKNKELGGEVGVFLATVPAVLALTTASVEPTASTTSGGTASSEFDY
jgi:hypothetical protein